MDEMKLFFWRHQVNIEDMNELVGDMRKAPELLPNRFEFYEMDPEEQRTDLLKRLNKLSDIDRDKYFIKFDPTIGPSFNWWVDPFQGLMPGIGLHFSMF